MDSLNWKDFSESSDPNPNYKYEETEAQERRVSQAHQLAEHSVSASVCFQLLYTMNNFTFGFV